MYRILIATLLAGATACATASAVPPVDTSAIQYRAQELQLDTLGTDGVAILPLGASDKSTPLRPFAERMLHEQIQALRPDAKVVRVSDAQQRLQSAAAQGAYANLLDTHGQTDQVSAETLAVVGDAVGARYLLIGYLEKDNSVAYGVQAVEARIYAQLWDSVEGRLVWEGMGGGAASASTPTPQGTPQSVAVRQAARGLALRLGRSSQDVRDGSDPLAVHAAAADEIGRTAMQNEAAGEAAVLGGYMFLILLEAILD